MASKDKKPKTIASATGLKQHESRIRVVMPNPIANAVAKEIGGQPMPALRYDEEAEQRNSQFNWHQLEELMNEISSMIATTANEFGRTIKIIKMAGKISDQPRFLANVKVTMEDLDKFTDEFMQIKAKHEGKNGFIETAEDRMLYLSVFEDYRALATYFQGTMHHKMIEFTEYALDAKDALVAATATAEAPAEAPIENTATEVKND